MKKLLSVLLAVTMTLALFSGIVIFDASAVYNGIDTSKFVQVPIPGFNQYTPEQMGEMAISKGSNYSFKKDEAGHTVITGDFPDAVDQYGSCELQWTTAKTFDQWKKNELVGGLSIFGDVDLSNKFGFRFKICNPETGEPMQFQEVGFCFGSSTKCVAIDFRRADYDSATGYYIVDFAKTGWYGVQVQGDGWWQDCPTIADTYYKVIDQFQIKINGADAAVGTTLSFYIDDFYADAYTDTTELGKAIQLGDEAGIDTTDALTLYRNKNNQDQAAVDAATQKILTTIEETKYGREKAHNDLDELLNIADALGFFDDGSEYFDLVSEADAVYSNPDALLSDLQYEVAAVRAVVAEQLMDEDLYEVFAKCNNVWKYNYTDASYKALASAIDEAWLGYEDDKEAAINTLNNAYDALEPLLVRASTADFFEGWTTEAVNEVVTANSSRLCDSIGDGTNTPDVWNGGDFSNNTTFEAYDNFIMTALTDFAGASMGWKNMDRSGTLAGTANFGYPEFDTTGLAQCEGIRFKLDVEGGKFDRLLIGLSNCADMNNEMYALRIRPESIDEEGYINVPFSVFQKAWWTDPFTKKDIENARVIIFEAYGATEGTSVMLSDFAGYRLLETASADDIANLNSLVEKLQAFDIDSRFTDLVNEAEALTPADFSIDYKAVADKITAALSAVKDPSAAIVDVPGFSIFTQAEMNQFPYYSGGGGTTTKTERGLKFTLSNGSWEFVPAKGVDLANTGYGENDCVFGQVEAINGKDFPAMLGGYTLSDIYAYRFTVENPGKMTTDGMNIYYKDGVGLWKGMFTQPHKPQFDGTYYTYYVDEIPVGGNGGWYEGNGLCLDRELIKANANFIVASLFDNVNRDIYGWQVILYKSVDRSALKQALVDLAGLSLPSYDAAMDLYYNGEATEEQIAKAAEDLVKEATPKAPAAPVATKITATSVTLQMAPDTIQYKRDNGEWTSDNVFTGLSPNTQYSFYARVAPVGNIPASEPSEALVVTTDKAPLEGEAIITGDAVYGKTLTASVDGFGGNVADLTFEWFRGTTSVGTGATYTLVKEDIGNTLYVVVSSAKYAGTLTSDATAEVAKAIPAIVATPAPVEINVGEALGVAELVGGEASVPGTWAWADATVQPSYSQSGSVFGVVFNPEDADCYESVTADVVVTVLAEALPETYVDESTGISISGNFLIDADVEMTVSEIAAGDTAYLGLLRSAKKSTGNTLILLKDISFASECYIGELALSANIGTARAGITYTVWFFAKGEVISRVATVAEDGTLTVEGLVF